MYKYIYICINIFIYIYIYICTGRALCVYIYGVVELVGELSLDCIHKFHILGGENLRKKGERL